LRVQVVDKPVSAHRAQQTRPRIFVLIAKGAANVSTNSCSSSVAPDLLLVIKTRGAQQPILWRWSTCEF